MISYAQNFEDVMLERLFAEQSRGFYVDVGAWDPHRLSTTKHFYLRGWRGINIEPIETRCELFQLARPEDINLNVAISPEAGEIAFWVCREDDARSTAQGSTAEMLKTQGFSLIETKVRTRCLDEIFAQHALKEIDFLKIDVEGREADTIKTMSFETWRPRVLLIEATRPGMRPDWSHPEAIGTWQSWEPQLLERGYVFAHFDGLNRFYVRVEEKHLAARLQLPPGVFDEIEENALNAGRAADLVDNLQRFEAHRIGQVEAIQRLDTKNAARLTIKGLQAENAARLEVIQRLDAESAARLAIIQRLEAENAARLEVTQRLEAENGARLDAIQRLDAESAARLEIIQRLEAENAARLDVIKRLDAENASRLQTIQQLNLNTNELREKLEAAELQQTICLAQIEELQTILEIVRQGLGWGDASREHISAQVRMLHSIRGALKHLCKRIGASITAAYCNLLRGNE